MIIEMRKFELNEGDWSVLQDPNFVSLVVNAFDEKKWA